MSFRTDRHNNPTAFTTAVAETAGLKEGLEYEQGEPFTVPGPKGPITYYTAKLLQNPIELTIRVIDQAGFYTKYGSQRWTYIAMPQFIWSGLTRDDKKRAIGWMYGHEGGRALQNLFLAQSPTA